MFSKFIKLKKVIFIDLEISSKIFFKYFSFIALNVAFDSFGLFALFYVLNSLLSEQSLFGYNLEGYFYLVFIFLFLIYFLKFCLNVYVDYSLNKFFIEKEKSIIQKIFKKILFQNFEHYFSKNTSQYNKNILVEVKKLTLILSSFFYSLMDLTLLLILAIFLIITYTKTFLILTLPLVLYASFFNKVVLVRSKKWGSNLFSLNKSFSKLLSDSFKSYYQIHIYNIFKTFFENLKVINNSMKNIEVLDATVKRSSKYLLEITLMFTILFTILFNKYYLGQSEQQLLVLLSTLGVISLKVLPVISRLSASFQNLHYNISSVEILKFNKLNRVNESKLAFIPTKIAFKKCEFSYGDKFIFKNLDFSFKKGDKIGIIGESGVGKSTLINLIIGLLKFDNGKILVDGENQNIASYDIKKFISYVTQETFLLDDTVSNNIVLNYNFDQNLLNNVCKLSGISDMDLDRQVGENGNFLSGGQKQRVSIARALYKTPELIIFDEATSSLDPYTEKQILDTINNLDVTIIFVSHNKECFKKFNRVYDISDNKLSVLNQY